MTITAMQPARRMCLFARARSGLEQAKLVADDAASGDFFGAAVSTLRRHRDRWRLL